MNNTKLSKSKIIIFALSWRDISSPKKGGAEVHTHEMLRRLDMNKYEVIHMAPEYEGLQKEETIDGILYMRRGNIVTVIWHAFLFYKRNASNIDFVIDQCNTHRFFTSFWVPRKKRIFYIHQTTREIWDINAKFPLNKIGKFLETPMLKLNKKDYALTVSESTLNDLVDVGFDKNKIFIIPPSVKQEVIPFWNKKIEKEPDPTFIYVGRYSRYKGMDVCIRALANIKKQFPAAKLWICGKRDKEIICELIRPLCKEFGLSLDESGELQKMDVVLLGFVTEEEKYMYMAKSHALLFPSIREGWGVIVTEAGTLGTPSIVYDAPGTIDAVAKGRAGYLCGKQDYSEFERCMKSVCLQDEEYLEKRNAAIMYSRQFIWQNTENMLDAVLEKIQTDRKKCRKSWQ